MCGVWADYSLLPRALRNLKMFGRVCFCTGLGPRTSHQRQPGQWEVNFSRSSCVTCHVIFLVVAVLCHQALE